MVPAPPLQEKLGLSLEEFSLQREEQPRIGWDGHLGQVDGRWTGILYRIPINRKVIKICNIEAGCRGAMLTSVGSL